MKRQSFSKVTFGQDDPVPSDFLLDLRQQIVGRHEPVAPKTKKHRQSLKLNWHWPRWRIGFKVRRPNIGWPRWRMAKTQLKISWPIIKLHRPVLLRIRLRRPQAVKPIFGFLILCLVLILPFKLVTYIQDLRGMTSRVVNASSDGLTDLKSAGQLLANRDFLSASDKFNQASANFNQAQRDLQGVQSWLWQLALVVPTSQTRLAASAPLITQAGDLAGQVGNDLTVLVDGVTNNLSNKDTLAIIGQINVDSQRAWQDSQTLNQVIKKINPTTLPQGYRDQLIDWQAKLQLLSETLQQTVYWSQASLDLLGDKMDRRYLVVFQNNAEARATGGFVGSYALLDLSRGKIKNLEIPKGGSYDTNGNLRRFVNPPLALRLVDTYWKFWDANWWPDWPTSARQLAWFLAESNGPTVDGVIAITPDVLEDLLEITGPIDLTTEHGLIITADNFRYVVQDNVENKVSGDNQPKKIIGDLAAAVMAKLPSSLIDQRQVIQLVSKLSKEISTRHILFYFNNQEIQQSWEKTGLSGQLSELEDGQDYLQVVNTNIAGGKTDLRIRQTIEQSIELQSDGSVINDVTIVREHTGEKSEGLYGVRNVDWLRLYVPEGSQLLLADGFSQPESHFFQSSDSSAENLPAIQDGEGLASIDAASNTLVYQELGRTVFANWSMVDPGQTAKLHFRYRLPFNLLDNSRAGWLAKVRARLGLSQFSRYQLIIDNQSGQAPTTWRVRWTWPTAWNLLWSSPAEIIADNWQADQLVNHRVAGLLFQVNK